MPVVSVIVPVYNAVSYLEEAVESICVQTLKDIEIILVDDGCTDGSGQLCDELAKKDDRIRVLHGENRGVVAARGAGIEAAEGEFLSFVDADDKIEPDMLGYMVEKGKHADLVTSGVLKYVSPNQVVKCADRFSEGVYEGEAYREFMAKMLFDEDDGGFQKYTPWMWNKLYRSKLVKEVYSFVDKEIRHAEDAVFSYLYLLRCRKIVITKEFFYHYLYRETSVCHKVNDRMLTDINKGYLVLRDVFLKHPMSDVLNFQLQKWVVKNVCYAINSHMGFDVRCAVPEFMLDLSAVKQRRVVLYGAGRMGKDYKKQMDAHGCGPVLWVDGDWSHYKNEGLDVTDPQCVRKTLFDMVLIAVSREQTAEEIKNRLFEMGVEKEKCVWQRPISVF